MGFADSIANRLGFIVLGLTNNFAYVIMLSAAFDLLNLSSSPIIVNSPSGLLAQSVNTTATSNTTTTTSTTTTISPTLANEQESLPYCNHQSTSTVLLADSLPSLTTKALYPFLLADIPTPYKALATATLSASSFLLTGLSTDQLPIFIGIICASFSTGLGEATYLSNTPLYGDVSLIGWSMGTGAAGLMGSVSYALLRMVLPVKHIMMIMLLAPMAMLISFFLIIRPIKSARSGDIGNGIDGDQMIPSEENESRKLVAEELALDRRHERRCLPFGASPEKQTNYGSLISQRSGSASTIYLPAAGENHDTLLKPSFGEKLRFIPSLSKYIFPLLLVFFAEYFINQGLFELIYYPEISFLNHAAQYRWFQVSYQLGVMISRSSLDFLKIRNIWAMSLLQCFNAILFYLHTAKHIYIPDFYLVLAIIVYEGLLGGFTYVNGFYRIKTEVKREWQAFSIGIVATADSIGIVIAGLLSLPTHNALCKLYE